MQGIASGEADGSFEVRSTPNDSQELLFFHPLASTKKDSKTLLGTSVPSIALVDRLAIPASVAEAR